MLSAILSFFGIVPAITSTITNITNAIANEKIAQISATTQQDQIASQERVVALTAQRDLLIAEASQSKLPIYMQTLIASGPAFILCKIFLYDKIFDGTTNILPNDPLWNVIMMVVGFYFLHSMVTSFKK